MTSNRATQIGIDRLVRLAWLERTTSLVLGGSTPIDIKATLQNDLCEAFQSGMTEKRGSLGKTITILMKVWLTTPRELAGLRIAGLELIKRMPKHDRMAIHWGMVMAVYPFWASVASQVGRLLKLQGSAAASQVQRRLREQYGEREPGHRTANTCESQEVALLMRIDGRGGVATIGLISYPLPATRRRNRNAKKVYRGDTAFSRHRRLRHGARGLARTPRP